MKSPLGLLLVLSLFFAVSCKKKKENPVQNPGSFTVTQVPKKVDGYLHVYYYYKILKNASKFSEASINAMFYGQAHNKDSLYYLPFDADVGNMTINDSILNKEIIGPHITYYYPMYSEVKQISNTRVWHISGNGSFKTMSVIDTTPFPEYFATALPDTIFRTADNTIKLGNYTGTDPVQVMIQDPLGRGATASKTPSRSARAIKFTRSDFYLFSDSDPVTIRFNLTKTSYQTVEGKVLCLTSHMSYETHEIPFKF